VLDASSIAAIVTALRHLRAALADPAVGPANEFEKMNPHQVHIVSRRVEQVRALLGEQGHLATLDPRLPVPQRAKLSELWQLPHYVWHRRDLYDQLLLFVDETIELLKPRRREAHNEARNRYCYNQLRAGKSLKDIRLNVNARQGWNPLESYQAVSQAAKRYAQRHGLPWPLPKNY
jgi:hypothetical protein